MLKHSEKLNKKKIKLISFISFLMGFSQAFFLYVMSSYFKQASGMENVGVFYLAAYAITLIAFLNLHKIIKKIGKSDVFHFSLAGKIIIILSLLFNVPAWLGIILVIVYIIFNNLEVVSLDIILESYSSDRMSGRIRGKFLTILNLGFLLAPFLSTILLEKYDYYGIFLALLVLNLFIFLVGALNLGKVNHRFTDELTVKDVIKKTAGRKDIRKIFYISFVLEFFYALMVIYTPIYLIDLGLSWDKIGIIFTFMLVPFVILQYPMGILADKKTGEKEFLIAAIILMGLSTLVVYFTGSKSILVWSVILFFTRIGAALVEILRDSYFFKRIDGRDVDLINIFKTSMPAAYIAASAVSAVFLLFFPVKIIFILVGAVVLSALWPAFNLTDNRSEKEMRK